MPSPIRSAAKALPPLPTSMAMAMNTVMMGMATVAVDKPISPMAWPRKMESMTLYAPLTSMPKMEGTANSVIRRGMDSVPMRVTLSCCLGLPWRRCRRLAWASGGWDGAADVSFVSCSCVMLACCLSKPFTT